MVRRREEGLGALLPWFSAERRRRVVADFGAYRASLAERRLPSPEGATPLASAIHGLGLVVATAMAGTGAIVYAVMGADGSLSGTGRLVLELHEILSNLMWAYLIGHAGIAIVHDILGHRVLGRMFLGQE
jgi:cytochrome b561